MNDDFWTRLAEGHTESTVPNAVDTLLQGKAHGEGFESVRHLTDLGRAASALPLPVEVGTRVSFTGSLGALMSTTDPPDPGALGEVVNVRSANGEITAHEGKVFVKWDDGKFRPTHAEFLREASASTGAPERTATADPTDVFGRVPVNVGRIRVASLGDLSSFLKLSNDSSTLIHRSTKELWTFNKDADGGFTVNRMWDDNGQPLKG
jgi:hypothetical protein